MTNAEAARCVWTCAVITGVCSMVLAFVVLGLEVHQLQEICK